MLIPALAVTALVEQAQGHTDQAVNSIAELDHATRHHHGRRARYLPAAVRVLISANLLGRAERFLSGMVVSAARDRHSLLTGRALVAEAAGQFQEGSDLYPASRPVLGRLRLCPRGGTSTSGVSPLGARICFFIGIAPCWLVLVASKGNRFSHPDVEFVLAHTLPDRNASRRVLE